MKRTQFISRSLFASFVVFGLSNGAALAGGKSVEACGDLYGVAKSNCIQAVNSGRMAMPNQTSPTASIVAGNRKGAAVCEDLYGVAKSNCLQDHRSGRAGMIAKTNNKIIGKASVGGCDNLYGVARTNCDQAHRSGRHSS
ncbi:MAG: hypothetical protein ACKVP2_18515 [Burkholderiales bacterium]